MKLELHAHTSDTSPCGNVPAEDLIRCYAEQTDYDAVVITDHFNNYVLEGFHIADEHDRVTRYLLGYTRARETGKQYGMRVLFGIEVSLYRESRNDYLIYGATPDFLYEHPYLYEYTQKDLFRLCDDRNFLMIQAHPNRDGCTPANPEFLHGAEVHNGHIYQNNHNERTLPWAEQYHLIQTSGSDYHHYECLATGGIETSVPVVTEQDLADCLRSGAYRLLRRQ